MNLRPRQIKAVDDVSAAFRAGFKAPAKHEDNQD